MPQVQSRVGRMISFLVFALPFLFSFDTTPKPTSPKTTTLMTNTPPTDQEMTDVFSRFSAPLPPASQPADDRIKISDRKKAAVATAAVLLGGGATFAAVNADLIENPFENENDGTEGGEEPTDPPETSTLEVETTPVRHNIQSEVQNGTITPSENIEIAETVEPGMTFGQAYATAREEVGKGGIFSWRGEVYNTYTVEEWQGLSFGQRQEFLVQVGYRPTGQARVSGPTEPPLDTPDLYEFTIDGRPAIGVDEDHDGTADAIIFLDEETNDLIAYMDMGGDDRIDSIYRYDLASEQVVGMQTIEEPFIVDVHRLEEISSAAYQPTDSNLLLAANDDKTFDEDDSFAGDDDYTDDSGYVNDAAMPEMD